MDPAQAPRFTRKNLSNDNEQHLNPGSQPLADGSDENGGKPKRQRKPSESKRLKASLKTVTDAGLAPTVLRFLPDGAFEFRFDDTTPEKSDDFDDWFNKQLAGDE